ncbi:MAG: TolC family outer membrane protein [Candidatus Accumulibacter sp.]|jgi:outer membrane protein|nr:TolC family outer membrane protein [Accumulibacter sp.]
MFGGYAVLLCRAVFVFFLFAAPGYSADLLRVYREALVNDPQYAAARAAAEAGREKLPQGLAGLLPTIGVSGSMSSNDNDYRVDRGARINKAFDAYAYTVTLSQPLFRWQNLVQYSQAKLQVAHSEATFAQASQDLILRVARTYFDVLNAQENLKALRASKEAIAHQLEQAQKSFAAGLVTATDPQEAQSRFDLALAQEIAAETELAVRRYALWALVGKEMGELNRLKTDAVLNPPQPAVMDSWVEAARADSFLVQAQQAAYEAAAKEVERVRAAHYPTLDIVGNYGRARTQAGIAATNLLQSEISNIGVQITVPIFQGGYVNSKTREAIAVRAAAGAMLESARRSAELEARRSFLGALNGIAQARALQAALRSSVRALESNRLAYDIGVRINIDVLNAENQAYVTRRDLNKASFDALLALLQLKASVGALGETDLEQINRLFEAP